MSAAGWAAVVVMALSCALILAAFERARFGLRQRIRQRLGQSPQAVAPRPFGQSFALNLLFVSVIVAGVLATQQFSGAN